MTAIGTGPRHRADVRPGADDVRPGADDVRPGADDVRPGADADPAVATDASTGADGGQRPAAARAGTGAQRSTASTAGGPAVGPAVGPTSRRATPPDARALATAIGTSVALLGVLLTGFAVYLFAFTGVQESHSQATLYKTFRNQLAFAVAPTGPVAAGRPVAILQVPSMDLHRSVVVEGTGPGSLTRGPGHRTDSPLPGQAGTSYIYARRETFGAPFAHFARIRLGDIVTVTTAQGVSRYRIMSSGENGRSLSLPSANSLVLATADSQTVPRHTYLVAASLIGQPFPSGSALPQATTSERALGVDTSALQPLMMWSLALVAVVTLTTLMRQRWAKWPTYLCAVPIALAVLWNVYENAAQLLPNVY